jgi:cell division protein FtsW (lipid II flippase)/cell division protein FtsI/penicillin-binding protein 2
MFLSFLHNIDKRHASVIEELKNRRAVVLSPDCREKDLSEIIFNNGYAESEKDADFIASVLVNRQKENGQLPSLYTLQKRLFGQVPVSMADSCGVLTQRLNNSFKNLGQTTPLLPFDKDKIKQGNTKITVSVYQKVESNKWWKKLLRIEDEFPCQDVPVQLIAHFRDSLNQPSTDTIGFIMTDANGLAVFNSLNTEDSYSVLPIKKGFEYGTSRGTRGGKWLMDKPSEGLRYSFEQKEHRILLFNNGNLKQIKAERTILVRSPQEYKEIVVKWFSYIMLAWWILLLVMIIKKKKFSGALVASCMFPTGLCVLIMFSMQDPLNDELHGAGMGEGVVYGLVACVFFQFVDFVKFYQNNSKVGFDIPINIFRWFFKPYRQKVARLADILKSDKGFIKKLFALTLVLITIPFLLLDLLQITRLSKAVDKLCERLPKGIGWLIVALLLTALLWTPFGQAIGGMKVNLKLFGLVFQPSEIAKYLILLFMAAFFTQQADTIIAYSQPHRADMLGSKLKTLLWIIIGLAALMAMYLILGDMGPGLVIGITFILLYSLIKSKVNLEHLDEEGRWKRIFTCDFAMLVYGVLTFAVFLIVGYKLGNMLLFGVLWFVFWIVLGLIVFKKQLFESALLMNAIVFLFIFGGRFIGYLDKDAGKRFEERVSMCSNTWGSIDLDNIAPDLLTPATPVSNTQVANGLWALSTGGMRGQGWGGGKPSLVPAFHTDMILSSIGEQMGWIGLLMVVIALAVLLRKMAVIGYRVGHPFAFYLCLGFAIVIGVQFFVIALGSTGIIPLTGVTVPFLSFGRVSMILNLAAFGIVLSLCNNIREDETAVSASVRQNAVEQYSYPIAMVTMVFLFFAISTLLVWQYYQLWKRDNTLIHPVYVHNTEGKPVVEYNPRINLLVRNMDAGRIYDRNGILLATSDKTEIRPNTYIELGIDQEQLNNMLKRNQKRYYPMGEQMFFMVGDINTGVLFSYDENHPVGYMAEAQHLSYLRGFDNVLYDKDGNPIKVKLRSEDWKENTYLTPKDTVSDPILLRDYSELLKFLKDGIDGKKVEQHNRKVKEEKYDLHLTVDAALQSDLQNSIATYMHEKYRGNAHFHLMRVSAVVLDAENGDLLASANYPLPNYNTIIEESKTHNYYSDNFRKKDWDAYTDVDLGTVFRTMPGSTAKVMSAMAGLMKEGTAAANKTYNITADDAVEIGRGGIVLEPLGPKVNMEISIVKSSNCYFMNLVNDLDLYACMDSIYKTTGVSIGTKVPYYYTAKKDNSWRDGFDTKVRENRNTALIKYESYRNDVRRGIHRKMDAAEWKWAWGQGYFQHELQASPLNMARVASTVVNNGRMPVTQYLLGNNKYERELRNVGSIQLLKSDEASILKSYMLAEARNQKSRNGILLPTFVGGKTGTPERTRVLSERRVYNKRTNQYRTYRREEKLNDGWYMFFVEGDATHHPIAVAVRMERGLGSGPAVRLTGNLLLDCLNRHGYIKND